MKHGKQCQSISLVYQYALLNSQQAFLQIITLTNLQHFHDQIYTKQM